MDLYSSTKEKKIKDRLASAKTHQELLGSPSRFPNSMLLLALLAAPPVFVAENQREKTY